MRRKIALVALVPMLLSAGHAQEPKKAEAKHFAKEVVVKAAEFDDLGAILHIDKRSGHVKFHSPCKTASIEMEFYRKGHKLPNTLEAGSVVSHGQIDQVDFVMQTLDTDYLPVTGSKKNHCRLLLGVKLGGAMASATHDVDKTLFDFSQTGSGSTFAASASSEGRVPLFWFVTKTNTVSGANTVEEVVERNKSGDLAIFYLRLAK